MPDYLCSDLNLVMYTVNLDLPYSNYLEFKSRFSDRTQIMFSNLI